VFVKLESHEHSDSNLDEGFQIIYVLEHCN
jgi:hypothetical protein